MIALLAAVMLMGADGKPVLAGAHDVADNLVISLSETLDAGAGAGASNDLLLPISVVDGTNGSLGSTVPVPSPAAAPAPTSITDAFGLVPLLTQAIADKNWPLAVGVGLVLVVFVVRTFLLKPEVAKHHPWVAVLLTFVTTLAAALWAGQPWLQAGLQAFGVLLGTAGAWGGGSSIHKRRLKAAHKKAVADAKQASDSAVDQKLRAVLGSDSGGDTQS